MMLTVQAQKNHYEDVVYLKNGSIIRGIIIEQIPNVSLKIQTREENIFAYKIEEVEKITKELAPHKEKRQIGLRKQSNDYSPFNRPKVHMGLLEFEGGLGVGNWAADRAGVSILYGYRIIPQFALGIGTGARLFFYRNNSEYNANDKGLYIDVAIPLFLHLRSDFLERKVSPYVAFNIGYNLSLSRGLFGGILMEPTLGVWFNIGENSRMNIGLACAINRVKYIIDGSRYSYRGNAMGYALNLKIGFSF